MANCDKQFKSYNNEIKLTEVRIKSLKKSRKELRRKVREFFKNKKGDKKQPKFSGQGSLLMGTIINPIARYKTVAGIEKIILYYDVDDGIYFEGEQKPADRDSIQNYHDWVFAAIDGHTDTPAEDKDTCIRTWFSDGHNIDNPIYYMQTGTPELAHKKKGWILSDPKAFSDWFLNLVEIHPQLRRLVRFLKGWADNVDFNNPSKEMPSGIVLTILAARNAVYNDSRADIALKETLVNIEANLKLNFKCDRPTTPVGENLLENYKYKSHFLDRLSDFIKDAKMALSENNEKKATQLWRKHLSDRFPIGEDKEQDENRSFASLGALAMTSKPFQK